MASPLPRRDGGLPLLLKREQKDTENADHLVAIGQGKNSDGDRMLAHHARAGAGRHAREARCTVSTPSPLSPHTERRHASWVLRLLLDPSAATNPLDNVDWDLLLDIARSNSVLVRAAERLAALGVRVPEPFAAAVAHDQQRVRSMLDLVRHVSRACEKSAIEFVFPKAFQDYPDMGDDVDLLVLPRSLRVDRGILAGLEASAIARDLGQWLAGTVAYEIRGYPSPLDVQHGRLGVVGEHGAFPPVLIHNRRRVVVEGAESYSSPPEDQLVLQGLQRVSGRLRIALCDVVFTVSAIRGGRLDWDTVIATARRHGALPGLSCYLGYVDQIYGEAFGQPLLSNAVRQALLPHLWGRGGGRIEFRRGGYRFPILRVNSLLYLEQLRARIACGDWAGGGRLCLIPIVGAVRVFRRLARGSRGTEGAGGGGCRGPPPIASPEEMPARRAWAQPVGDWYSCATGPGAWPDAGWLYRPVL